MGGFAVTYAVIGLFFSALFRRTGIAVGASYVFVVFCLFGTLFVYLVVGVMRGEQPPNWMLALNPFSVLASALVDGVVTDPNNVFGSSSVTPVLWGLAGGRFENLQTRELALWWYALGIYGWLTVFLFALTTQLVKPVQRFRFRPLTWALLVLLFVGPIVAVLLLYTAFGFGGSRAAWRWWTTSEHNVVANANFAEPLEKDWQMDPAIQMPSATGGSILAQPISVMDKDGKHALRVWNSDADAPREFAISQPLNIALPDHGTVRLRVTMRIAAHSAPVCGKQGDACPLMVKLKYTDTSAANKEWTRGFYTSGQADAKLGLPSRCRTCPGGGALMRVSKNKWFTFESGDLFERTSAQALPKSLDKIVLLIAGAQYEVQVAEVGVLVHEGRPFSYGKKNATPFVWSVSNLVPWWMWSFIGGGLPVRFDGPVVVPMGNPMVREIAPVKR
jgi:hypothetical protein